MSLESSDMEWGLPSCLQLLAIPRDCGVEEFTQGLDFETIDGIRVDRMDSCVNDDGGPGAGICRVENSPSFSLDVSLPAIRK